MFEYFAEPLLRFIQRYRALGVYQRLEWVTNGTFQLQRLAHEELGAGDWADAAEELPTLLKDQCLATLDISKQKHPRLVYKMLANKEGGSTDTTDQQRTPSHNPSDQQIEDSSLHVSSPERPDFPTAAKGFLTHSLHDPAAENVSPKGENKHAIPVDIISPTGNTSRASLTSLSPLDADMGNLPAPPNPTT